MPPQVDRPIAPPAPVIPAPVAPQKPKAVGSAPAADAAPLPPLIARHPVTGETQTNTTLDGPPAPSALVKIRGAKGHRTLGFNEDASRRIWIDTGREGYVPLANYMENPAMGEMWDPKANDGDGGWVILKSQANHPWTATSAEEKAAIAALANQARVMERPASSIAPSPEDIASGKADPKDAVQSVTPG